MTVYNFINEIHHQNQEIFQTNSSIHKINSRYHLHTPNANLSCFQKSPFYAAIRIFNSLPPSVIIKNAKAKFRAVFRKYRHTPSFYTVDKVLHVQR
jgi:hypothetical protein